MRDFFSGMARPEGVYNSFVDKPLVSLTEHEQARETAPAPALAANLRACADALIFEGGETPKPRRQCIQAFRDGKTYVYFIGGDEGPVKIGITIAPLERLAAMQMGCPIKLHIIAKVEGTVELEKEYHRRFAAFRLHGEWFERSAEIIAEIEAIGRPVQGGTAEPLGRFA